MRAQRVLSITFRDPSYLAEFDYRWTTRKETNGELGFVEGKRLTYKPLTAKKINSQETEKWLIVSKRRLEHLYR